MIWERYSCEACVVYDEQAVGNRNGVLKLLVAKYILRRKERIQFMRECRGYSGDIYITCCNSVRGGLEE